MEAVSKMAFGNRIGVRLEETLTPKQLTAKDYGYIVVETEHPERLPFRHTVIGHTTDKECLEYNGTQITMDEALAAWTGTLEGVFPTSTKKAETPVNTPVFNADNVYICKHKTARPKVFIPVFPGTNCEYDSAKAFQRAGADAEVIVFNNMNASNIRQSVEKFAQAIRSSQMIMIPGGFSAGDEPDGSGKFITSVFRNPRISDEVMALLNQRDGLMLGICNGFQALVKLGLVPYGDIRPQTADAPTLTMNTIGRHQSKMAYTKVVSNLSPWLHKANLGGTYVVPISHGEGRFVAPQLWLDKLFANGQVATQYVDLNGNPTMNEDFNMNGSYLAIEGITSPDGRVLGKMAHSERRCTDTALNIFGDQDQLIFESGVEYFK